MASTNEGKDEVLYWMTSHFSKGSTCLDVGACDGKWKDMLGDYFKMDAVEIYAPNIEAYHLEQKYNKVFNVDIADFTYDYYDYIIFGDVIEHMTVENAQKALNYAYSRCKDMIIGIPFLWSQGALYGNQYEIHIQNDLTKELFEQRYPGYEKLFGSNRYAYYHKG